MGHSRKNFGEYFAVLATRISQVKVTGPQGEPIGLEDGLDEASKLIRNQADSGKKLYFIGNGGSASIASHMAIDYWKNGGIPALAFNDGCLLTCIGNDFGYESVFEKPIEMFSQKGDVLIAISSSGRSENILRGARTARRKECHVITCSGFSRDNPLRREGKINFYVSSDSYGHVEIVHLILWHSILDLHFPV